MKYLLRLIVAFSISVTPSILYAEIGGSVEGFKQSKFANTYSLELKQALPAENLGFQEFSGKKFFDFQSSDGKSWEGVGLVASPSGENIISESIMLFDVSEEAAQSMFVILFVREATGDNIHITEITEIVKNSLTEITKSKKEYKETIRKGYKIIVNRSLIGMEYIVRAADRSNRYDIKHSKLQTGNHNCKIQGIIYSQKDPIAIIDANNYHEKDSVCGGKIIDIRQNGIVIEFQNQQENYKIGDTIRKRTKDINATVMNNSNADESLIEAIENGEHNRVKSLLTEGVNINAKGENGLTALMFAISLGQTKIANLLIDGGADVNAKMRGSLTTLMMAALANRFEGVRLLINNGADMNAIDKEGRTVLMHTAFRGKIKVVKILLNAGANINAKSTKGETALMLAAYNGNREVLKLLINKGAEIDSKNDKGLTALMSAAVNGQVEIVKLLLNEGADVNMEAKNGATALIAAATYGRIKIAKLLIERGADVNAKAGDVSVLMVAKERGHEEVVKVLKKAGAKEK